MGKVLSPPQPGPIQGISLIRLSQQAEARGTLTFGEIGEHLPFAPMRFFLVHDTPSGQTRGSHAHRTEHQFLVCLSGRCAILVDDGISSSEVILDSPRYGLYLPPLVWAVQHYDTPDTVLLVLSSAPYDPDEYIHSYEEFLWLATAAREIEQE